MFASSRSPNNVPDRRAGQSRPRPCFIKRIATTCNPFYTPWDCTACNLRCTPSVYRLVLLADLVRPRCHCPVLDCFVSRNAQGGPEPTLKMGKIDSLNFIVHPTRLVGPRYCERVAPAIASHPDHLRASPPPRSVSADWSSANPARPITSPRPRPLHPPVTTPPPFSSHTVSAFSAIAGQKGCASNLLHDHGTTVLPTAVFKTGYKQKEEPCTKSTRVVVVEAPWMGGSPTLAGF